MEAPIKQEEGKTKKSQPMICLLFGFIRFFWVLPGVVATFFVSRFLQADVKQPK
jgi:hypothetical protein